MSNETNKETLTVEERIKNTEISTKNNITTTLGKVKVVVDKSCITCEVHS
ncbi:hypothetical protein [Fusobacterium varium]